MNPVTRRLVNVSVSIQLEFYYHEYDWGVIYREIGGGDNSKFYKVWVDIENCAYIPREAIGLQIYKNTSNIASMLSCRAELKG